ncbi:MAG: hypothetical protein GXY72_13665, partial [Deltaproteobacteria bacterium]|nr:hypothetical protein [Deltaproteobacteria bacterium]
SRELTAAVVEEILQKKTVSVGNIGTVADFLAMLASWFYDFNFLPSRRLAIRRNLPGRIEKELPDNPVVRNLIAGIRNDMEAPDQEALDPLEHSSPSR